MRFLHRDNLFALSFTLLYALLLAWLMPRHEMWFDETEPWLLALYSDTYAELLQNKAYEGHPNVWYSLLYLITRFTQDLRALQVTQFVFAVGFVFVFLRYAPFHWGIRLLFCFGYYGLFEYGIISRLYALELLTTFGICAFYPRRFSHWYLYIGLLALNAHTYLFGLFFSGVVGLLLFAEAFGFWQQVPNRQEVSNSQRWMGMLLWSFSCYMSLWSMVRPSEVSQVMFNFKAATRPWQAFFPIPQFTLQFWNSSFLGTSIIGWAIEAILSILLLVFLIHSFRAVKQVVYGFLTLLLVLGCFFIFKYVGSLRHFGHYFVFTLCFAWLLYYYQSFSPLTRLSFTRLQKMILLATIVQAAVGLGAVYLDYIHPFHPSKDVAAYLEQHVTDSTIVVHDHQIKASSIVAYTGKPMLFLSTLTPSTFFQAGTPEKNELTPYQLLDWALALAQQNGKRVVLVSRDQISTEWYPYPVKLLTSFSRGYITPLLYFYLYQVDPLPLPKTDFVAAPAVVLPSNPPTPADASPANAN